MFNTDTQRKCHGRYPVAVVDRDAAELEIANRSDLVMGPVILPDVGLVWLFNTSSPTLYRRGYRFLARARTSGLVRQLVLNEFGSWRAPRNRTLLPIPEGGLSPYDELLRWVGRRAAVYCKDCAVSPVKDPGARREK